MSKSVGIEDDDYIPSQAAYNREAYVYSQIKQAVAKREKYDKIATVAGKAEKIAGVVSGAGVVGATIADAVQAAPPTVGGLLIGGLAAGIIAVGAFICNRKAKAAEKQQQNAIRTLYTTNMMLSQFDR